MIYLIPIEPLVERYSESWYRNIPLAFIKKGLEIQVIDGKPLTDVVETGTFLDINSTIAYKNSQMIEISKLFYAKKIKNGDIFFFFDVEFWGIESLRLMAQMNGITINIYGFLHAASHTIEDAFSIAAPYQKYTELGWVAACDKIFVGSSYSKESFVERRIKPYAKDDSLADKIVVTGNPLFETDYASFPDTVKKEKIIISNRFDWEKRPNLSLNFCHLFKKRYPGIEIAVTTSRPKFTSNKSWLVEYARVLESEGIINIYEGLTKNEYHKHLAESKVMLTNSIEECFGYCIVEALIYNCAVLAPNSCSHPELLKNSKMLFTSEDEILPKLEYFLFGEKCFHLSHYVDCYYDSMDNIISNIKIS